MQVQPASAAPAPPEPLSHIERFMQGLAKRIWNLVEPILIWVGWYRPPPPPAPVVEEAPKKEIVPDPPAIDVSFEVRLLKDLQIGTVQPPMVLRHFQERVAPEKQTRIYERLGQERITRWDFYRSCLDVGKSAVMQNPYIIQPQLAKALRKQIALVSHE